MFLHRQPYICVWRLLPSSKCFTETLVSLDAHNIKERRPAMEKRKRVFAGILAVIFICTLLFSFGFLSNNMHHDCTGEHCEICLEIEMAEQLISGIKTLFTLSFEMAVLCVFAHIFTKTKEEICVKNTLVSLKVELLD